MVTETEEYGDLLARIDRYVKWAVSGNWQTHGSAASICREIARLAMAAAQIAEEARQDGRTARPGLELE